MRSNFLWALGLLLIALGFETSVLLAEASTELPLRQKEQGLYQSLRLGIMIQGQGAAIYSWFGHAGIVLSGPKSDLQAVAQLNRKNFAEADFYTGESLLFDYGNFEATGKRFVLRFLAGELNYYKYYKSFQRYVRYNAVNEKRGTEVYWLNFNWVEKKQLVQILFRETRATNRQYKYNFYFDNCLTRIRDQLDEVFDGKLQNQFTEQSPWSIRQILRREIGDKFWGLLLMEFLQGAKIDQKYSRWDSTFLPSHMPKLLQELTIPNRNAPLVQQRETIFPFHTEAKSQSRISRSFSQNLRYLWLYCISLLAFSCFFWSKKSILPFEAFSQKCRPKTKKRCLSDTILRVSYFAICLLGGSIIAVFSAVLWLLAIFQSYDVTLQNALFFLATPFLLLQIILFLLFWRKQQRRRLSKLWLRLWRIHAFLAVLLVPSSAWLYSIIGQQNAQDILLPYLAVLPILLACAFVPSDVFNYFTRCCAKDNQ